jgi:hypothetical protein
LSAPAVLCCVLAACAPTAPTASGDPVLAKEQHAAASLKARYKDVILGTDVKGRTLTVYVDVDNMYSMDEDAEAAMKADALSRWKSIWSQAHPHKHGVLRLSMRDYYGKEVYSSSANV